ARFANEWWDHWGSGSLITFLRFRDADAARAFDAALPGFLDRHAFPPGDLKKGTYFQNITPLPALHLASPSDRAIVVTLAIVGLLTLLIAVVNYVNLATARAGLRAREVALRKVLGGTRASIMAQFLGEAVATVALAALIGLALAEAALPLVNAAGGTALSIEYVGRDGVLMPLAVTVIVVGLLAGTYPALVLSGFRPTGVLASARAPGGGRTGARVRRGLVVVQFAIAIAFAIGTAVMFAQVAHLRSADLGFRRDGLIVVRSFPYGALDQGTKDNLIRAFRATPGVVDATVGQYAPGDQMTTNAENYWLPNAPAAQHSLLTVPIAPDYFQTYGARLLAGRFLNVRYGGDDLAGWKESAAAPLDVIVNETALRELGIADPDSAIGQVLADPRPFRIVGVVADLHFLSPREPVSGTLYMLDTRRFSSGIAAVRYAGVDAATITARLEAAWKRVAPTVPFDARTVEQNLWENYYQQDARRARLFTIGAVLAVLIGCIGLYGLASFDTARRVKEIGIRKTLGASTSDVLKLLIAQFLKPVVIANLLAWPLAYFAMRKWLSNFDDRIALSPLFFIGATVLALAIACLTVFSQAWRVARAEPARALRYE
ncbi:MAG TPA: FtsX-like permease family protein, partial [Sphingomonas sp.]